MTVWSYPIVYDVISWRLRCRPSRHPKSNFCLSSSSYMSGDFIYPKLHRYHLSLKSYDPRVKMTPPQSSYSLKSPVAVGLRVHWGVSAHPKTITFNHLYRSCGSEGSVGAYTPIISNTFFIHYPYIAVTLPIDFLYIVYTSGKMVLSEIFSAHTLPIHLERWGIVWLVRNCPYITHIAR